MKKSYDSDEKTNVAMADLSKQTHTVQRHFLEEFLIIRTAANPRAKNGVRDADMPIVENRYARRISQHTKGNVILAAAKVRREVVAQIRAKFRMGD